MNVDPAIGKILGMVMAYAVSALGLLLAYYNYRKRIVKADRVFTPRAIAVLWVVGLLAVATIAVLIALQTAFGRQVAGFISGANTEVRRVVWPSRAETLQTTLAVLVVVLLVGIFLWLLDMLLLWAVQLLTGQGG